MSIKSNMRGLRVRSAFKLGLAGILAVSFSVVSPAQKRLSPTEAKEQPTFLNLDKPYPNQIFTVVIWGNNRSKFKTPEEDYKDKKICVTGKITAYDGLPEIIADDAKQIRIE
jgi:hypothetical protein